MQLIALLSPRLGLIIKAVPLGLQLIEFGAQLLDSPLRRFDFRSLSLSHPSVGAEIKTFHDRQSLVA
jgi:hypothetical protein